MEILDKVITVDELKIIAENGFGEMVKAVVDVDLYRISKIMSDQAIRHS